MISGQKLTTVPMTHSSGKENMVKDLESCSGTLALSRILRIRSSNVIGT